MANYNITIWDIELDVEYDYSPEEEMTYDDPGYPAEIIINGVYHEKINIIEILNQATIDRISETLIELQDEICKNAKYDRAEQIYQDRKDRVLEGY
jgi:hypothetical protein